MGLLATNDHLPDYLQNHMMSPLSLQLTLKECMFHHTSIACEATINGMQMRVTYTLYSCWHVGRGFILHLYLKFIPYLLSFTMALSALEWD